MFFLLLYVVTGQTDGLLNDKMRSIFSETGIPVSPRRCCRFYSQLNPINQVFSILAYKLLKIAFHIAPLYKKESCFKMFLRFLMSSGSRARARAHTYYSLF